MVAFTLSLFLSSYSLRGEKHKETVEVGDRPDTVYRADGFVYTIIDYPLLKFKGYKDPFSKEEGFMSYYRKWVQYLGIIEPLGYTCTWEEDNGRLYLKRVVLSDRNVREMIKVFPTETRETLQDELMRRLSNMIGVSLDKEGRLRADWTSLENCNPAPVRLRRIIDF